MAFTLRDFERVDRSGVAALLYRASVGFCGIDAGIDLLAGRDVLLHACLENDRFMPYAGRFSIRWPARSSSPRTLGQIGVTST